MPPRVSVFRIQDLVRDEAQFHRIQALMKAEGWTSQITRMSWAEFQGVPHVGEIVAATPEAAASDKH